MYKYLVIECEELDDQYECDANRSPVCLTNDIDQYGYGYEVYEIAQDGKLKLIKDYYKGTEEGMAIVVYDLNEDEDIIDIPRKFRNKSKKDFDTPEKIAEIAQICGFTENLQNIAYEIETCGEYGEIVGGTWVVFGNYIDNIYPRGC